MAVQYYVELGYKKCRTKLEGSTHKKNREIEGRTYGKEPSAWKEWKGLYRREKLNFDFS